MHKTWLLILGLLLAAGGCGDASDYQDGSGSSGVASLALSADSNSVDSAGTESANITATALNGSNAAVQGVSIDFSATAGQLGGSSQETDESGKAQVTFSASPSSPRNQVATVTASTGSISREIPIQISGTTLEVSPGKTDIPADGSDSSQVEITLKDSASNPLHEMDICYEVTSEGEGDLTVQDTSGNALSSDCPIDGSSGNLAGTTDVSGKLTIQVVGASAGSPTLNISGAGASASQDFKVSSPTEVFKISSPAKEPIPVYETDSGTHTVEVSGVSASEVTFSTSVGQWGNGSSVQTVTASDGSASAELQSAKAGIANLLVQESGPDNPSADSMKIAFTAPLSEADRLTLQADPAVVPVSGGSTHTAELIAKVETAEGEPVANAPVGFELVETTGGGETISPPYLMTETNGEAVTTFTSGSEGSSTAGITLKAKVPGYPSLTDTFDITITDQAGSVVLGQSSKIQSNSEDTAYILPMSVLVADVNGNPVKGATVSLSIWPTHYFTGYRNKDGDPVITGVFANEDTNENNHLDAGEDFNGDGQITPENSSAGNIPITVTTNDSGVGNFDLTYLKNYAEWVRVRIRARTEVGTSQVISNLHMVLPREEQEGSDLPPSPFNAVCAYQATASPDPLTLSQDADGDSNPDNTVTISASPVSGGTAPVDGLEVQASKDSEDILSVSTGKTDASGQLVSTIEAQGGTSGSAVIDYFVSCASVPVQVTWP